MATGPDAPMRRRAMPRRRLLMMGVAAATGAAAGGIARRSPAADAPAQAKPPAEREPAPPARRDATLREMRRSEHTFRLAEAQIEPAGKPARAFLVNGRLPGPELRLREGDWLRVTAANSLPMPATIHWHGILLPSPMDGVPDVTQAPIPPRDFFVYEFPIRQRGTYWYHSHFEFEEQLGLSGPLIIAGGDEPYAGDRDEVLFLSDWMNGDPWQVIPRLRAEASRGGMAGMAGMASMPGMSATPGVAAAPPATGMAMGATPVPPPPADADAPYDYPPGKSYEVDLTYDAYLLNGRGPAQPWACKARPGERIRLRLINGSASTFFRFAIDGHRLEVVEADGQPVEPVVVDDLVLATGETYDVVIGVGPSGSYTIHAAALGETGQAIGVLHTPDAKPVAVASRPAFAGRSLTYADLRTRAPEALPKGPVKSFSLPLGGDMARYLWSIGGQYFPTPEVPDGRADPLLISPGERVRVELVNQTAMFHPMHLHGHFFRLLASEGASDRAPRKHTAMIGPGERLRFEFVADNPGSWFFHCHNAYHLAAGMARVFRYVIP